MSAPCSRATKRPFLRRSRCEAAGNSQAPPLTLGTVATHATPDNRFAILATAAEQLFGGGNSQYIYHALYAHLTRLGCAPVIVADEEVEKNGVPAAAKVLFLVRQQQPFEPRVRAALTAFQQRGGKVIQTSDCLATVPGALTVNQPIKSIWQMSGFAGTIHAELWEEFAAHWRGPLTDALAQAGSPRPIPTAPTRSRPSSSMRFPCAGTRAPRT